MNRDKLDISAVVITYNEEKNIRRCLEALDWAKEIVVVDSGSTDRTVEIAQEYTDKVLIHAFEGYVKQKNYALDQVTGEWVLAVDANEVVSPGLLSSIRHVWSKEKDSYDGFTVNRQSRFCGKWIQHCGWYPDRKLRLFRRQRGRWTGEDPHDRVHLEGKVKDLDVDLLHYTNDDLADYIEQLQKFSTVAAQAKFDNGRRAKLFDLILRPGAKFLKAYLLKQGFRDGRHGLILCVCASFSVFLKYAKLWELQRSRDGDSRGKERS